MRSSYREVGFDPNSEAARLRTRSRIAAHVIWDHLIDPSATKAEDVPWRPEAIRPSWLTEVLCADAPDACVETITVSGGHEGSSVRRCLSVTYNDAGRMAGLPEELFVKSTPSLLTRLSSGMAAAGEGRFFAEIKPQLAIEVPTHHHSVRDVASGRTLHIFEDLTRTKAALFCNRATLITLSEAEQMVDILATVHGTFLGAADEGGQLGWLLTYESFFRRGERNGLQRGHDRAMEKASGVIPADVYSRRSEIWPAAVAALAVHREGPLTLLHNDVHLGNWYITGESRVGLGDWACLCRGHWARDVAYALATTLPIETRRRHERELLARYLDKMRTQGCHIESEETAWRQYRSQMIAALLMWTPTLCHAPTMPDMQPEEMSLLMIERITAAISDLDSLDAVNA